MRLHQTLTASLCVVLFACKEPSIPFGDQSGTSGRLNPPELQGTLHAKLGTDWADFERALETIAPWTGGHEQKRCSDMFACGFLFSKVRVQIQANPESKLADFNKVGPYGTILMKLVNTGERPTGEYGLRPQPTEYYVVVKNTGPSAWQWALVEKGKSASQQVGVWNRFNDCTPHHTPKKSIANFQPCHYPEPESMAIRTSSLFGLTDLGYSLTKAIQLAFAFESPGWISCAYGCCTLAY